MPDITGPFNIYTQPPVITANVDVNLRVEIKYVFNSGSVGGPSGSGQEGVLFPRTKV